MSSGRQLSEFQAQHKLVCDQKITYVSQVKISCFVGEREKQKRPNAVGMGKLNIKKCVITYKIVNDTVDF